MKIFIILLIFVVLILFLKKKENFYGMNYIQHHEYLKCCNAFGCQHPECKRFLFNNMSPMRLIGVAYQNNNLRSKIHKLYARRNGNSLENIFYPGKSWVGNGLNAIIEIGFPRNIYINKIDIIKSFDTKFAIKVWNASSVVNLTGGFVFANTTTQHTFMIQMSTRKIQLNLHTSSGKKVGFNGMQIYYVEIQK